MKKRALIPGERHHWWPKSLLKFWENDKGKIGRIDSSGNITYSTPLRTARISDAHNLRLNSPWDETFEPEFERPDNNFPKVVSFLESLIANHTDNIRRSDLRFCSHKCFLPDLEELCVCLISLVFRSPKLRQTILEGIKSLRKNVQKSEYKPLIAVNIGHTYRMISNDLSGEGKFLIIFTDQQEFIFGDGFYHNISISIQSLQDIRILAPITPNIAVLYVMPQEYMIEPRLLTLSADKELVDLINKTTQLYSKNCLFFRSQEPILTKDFLDGEYFEYNFNFDPIDTLIERLLNIN